MKARYEYLIRTQHADGTFKIRAFTGTDQTDAIENALFMDTSIKKAWIVDDTEALIRISETLGTIKGIK